MAQKMVGLEIVENERFGNEQCPWPWVQFKLRGGNPPLLEKINHIRVKKCVSDWLWNAGEIGDTPDAADKSDDISHDERSRGMQLGVEKGNKFRVSSQLRCCFFNISWSLSSLLPERKFHNLIGVPNVNFNLFSFGRASMLYLQSFLENLATLGKL